MSVPRMSALRVLPVLLLLAACSGNDAASGPVTASSAPPSAAPPAAASPSVAPDAVVLAVSSPEVGLRLYALAPGASRATRLRELVGPPGFVVQDVSLSSGSTPTTCAVWRPATGKDDPQLLCYAVGAAAGRVAAAGPALRSVAVRPDGRAVAWSSGAYNQSLTVADLAGDEPTVRTRQLYAAGEPEDAPLPSGIGRLDWVSERELAVVDDADSDDGKGLCFHDVTAARDADAVGFGRCVNPNAEESRAGYFRFEGAVVLAEGEVVTIERPQWCCTDPEDAPGARAVRLRPSDGKVLGVVAFPREGRDVTTVSGGPRAVVYETSAEGKDVVISVRWASASSGSPISGLPVGASVVAQP